MGAPAATPGKEAEVGTADGHVVGVHKVVDHGPDADRYNIVILGDGYRASELKKFAADVTNFVKTFRTTAPYDKLWRGINVHRVDVVSTDSGADDPGTCGDHSTGSGVKARTYFDSTFCGDGRIRRLLTCNVSLAKSTAVARVPAVHMTMVIVNTTEYGGSGGAAATFSTNSAAVEIGLHEMGHTAFGFADEYEAYSGCGSGETGHDHYAGAEPVEPNVTANANPQTIKWRSDTTSIASRSSRAARSCAAISSVVYAASREWKKSCRRISGSPPAYCSTSCSACVRSAGRRRSIRNSGVSGAVAVSHGQNGIGSAR